MMNASCRLPLFASVLCTLTVSSVAQRNFDDVEIRTTKVAGSVYMLEGAGGNIGVSVGSDGTLIVDSQFAPLAPKIEAAVGKLAVGGVDYLLNTHWHGDHTGGNAYFGRQATIVAHENVRSRMADRASSEDAKAGLPVITYQDAISVHYNGEAIKVLPLRPGHTDGDSVVYFTESNVVHTGDQFFNGRFPFIDPSSGGDVLGYLENVNWILQNLPDGATIIPGHGDLATRQDLVKFRDMLAECIAIVEKAIEDETPREEIVLPERYESWGQAFISTPRWIQILHNGLSD